MANLIVANDVVCNTGNTLVANSYQLTNLSPNASIHRVLVAGYALPNQLGSMSVFSPVQVTVNCGNTGWTADAQLVTTVCPSGYTGLSVPGLAMGAFAAEILVTLRANNKTASAPNLVFSGVGIDPVAVYATTNPVSNVNVVSTVTTTNVANISVWVSAGAANVVVQHCSICQFN